MTVEQVNRYIEDLYQAIIDEKEQETYSSFYMLVEGLGLKVNLWDLFSLDYEQFWSSATTVADVNWEKLIVQFIDILNNYRNKVSDQNSALSYERVEQLIKGLNAKLDEPYEVVCFDCGALIHANETKCSKCGWSWGDENKAP